MYEGGDGVIVVSEIEQDSGHDAAMQLVARVRGWRWFPPRAALREASFFSLCDECILEKHSHTRFRLFFLLYSFCK